MKLRKIISTLCIAMLLTGCSSSPKYEQLTIADASIDDMAIEINDTPFQLYEPISKVLDHGEWTIKEAEIEQDLNEGERANLDLIYDGNEDHIITVNVMNTEKGKVKVKNAILQEINFVNSKDEAMRFELPSSVNLGTEVSSVLKKYGTPNMYDRKTNGDYQITYVCTKNDDIKNIMALSFKGEKLTEVKLKSKSSLYNISNTTSFNL